MREFNLPVLIALAGLKSDGCDGGAAWIVGLDAFSCEHRHDGCPLVGLDLDEHQRGIMKIVAISVKVSDTMKSA